MEEGPYLLEYEDPDDPEALGVTDVNGEPGVSGGKRDDLVGCLAEHWGFHYLAYVSEAVGLVRMCGCRPTRRISRLPESDWRSSGDAYGSCHPGLPAERDPSHARFHSLAPAPGIAGPQSPAATGRAIPLGALLSGDGRAWLRKIEAETVKSGAEHVALSQECNGHGGDSWQGIREAALCGIRAFDGLKVTQVPEGGQLRWLCR